MEERINDPNEKIDLINSEKLEIEIGRNSEENVKRDVCNISKQDTSMIQKTPIRVESFTFGELSLPKFGNKLHENPMQYIKELENFFRLRMIPESSKVLMVKNSLYGSCVAWYDLYIDELVTTYNDFKIILKEHYWDTRKQSEIRNKIINGYYNPRNDYSMGEHMMKMAQIATFLEPPHPDRNINSYTIRGV